MRLTEIVHHLQEQVRHADRPQISQLCRDVQALCRFVAALDTHRWRQLFRNEAFDWPLVVIVAGVVRFVGQCQSRCRAAVEARVEERCRREYRLAHFTGLEFLRCRLVAIHCKWTVPVNDVGDAYRYL